MGRNTVESLAAQGIVAGTSATTVGNNITRADFIAVGQNIEADC